MANLGLKNNNPGNLKDPATGKFRVFATPQEGFDALIADIDFKKQGKSAHIKPGGTLMDLATVWAPASDNNIPANWAKNVASASGTPVTARWDSIPTEQLVKGIQAAEGTSNLTNTNNTNTKMTPDQFAQKIKTKYPQYQSVDNQTLTQKILAKYPQYQDQVQGSGSTGSTGSADPFAISPTYDNSNTITNIDTKTGQPTTDKGLVTNVSTGNFAAAGKNLLDAGSNALNWVTQKAIPAISEPFVGIAATPVQALAKLIEGENYQDPYRGGIGTKTDGSPGTRVSPLTVKDKFNNVKDAAITTSSVAGTGLLYKGATASILNTPTFKKVLVDELGMNYSKFMKLSKLEQLKALGDAASHFGKDLPSGTASIIGKAMEVLSKESPGLLKTALKLVTGGKVGALDVAGGYHIIKSLLGK